MKTVTSPQGCTNLKLRQLDRMVTRHYDQFVGVTGLKNTQYALLSHVVRLGPIRPGELARHMRMDASTLTRNLQPLAAQGLLIIGTGSDARSRSVGATQAGIEKRAEAQRAWKLAQAGLIKMLGSKRVSELHALIDACISRMDEPEDKEVS